MQPGAWEGISAAQVDPTTMLAPKAKYKYLGGHISIAPDAQYPWPEKQVRTIRERYDHGFVPLHRVIRMRETNTNSLWEFHHHGCGRWDPDAIPDMAIVNATKIQSGYGANWKANIVERWFQNAEHIKPGTKRFANNLPAPFISWGDWVLTWVMENCWAASKEEKRRFHRAVERRDEAAREASQEKRDAEAEFIDRGEAKHRKDLIDQLDPQDFKEWTARQTGAYQEGPTVEYSKQPAVAR